MRGETVVGVVTDDGVVEAGATIVAAGPWSSPLLEQVGVHLPIVGARGWLVRIAPGQPHLLTHLVEAAGPHAALHDDAGSALALRRRRRLCTASPAASSGLSCTPIATAARSRSGRRDRSG